MHAPRRVFANVAARLASQAQQDQIITSQETVATLSAALKAACRRLYSIQIKGKEREVKLCQLIWQRNEDMTALADFDATLEPRHATLRLSYRAMEIILDSARSSLSHGRDKSAELVIEDTKTSRLHCRVERRVNKFVLVDRSTNGTYVTFQGDPEVVLKREELALRGHGWIALGLPRADTAELVEFFCDG